MERAKTLVDCVAFDPPATLTEATHLAGWILGPGSDFYLSCELTTILNFES